MKTKLIISGFFKWTQRTLLILSLLFLLPAIVTAQLSGTYTIGIGGDFSTFSEAADSLYSQGVSAAIVFEALSGDYNEHFIINHVSGVSSENTITFKSQAGNTDSVLIFYQAQENDSNYVVKLNNVQYVTFKDMTFRATGEPYHGIIFDLEDYSANITIMDNVLDGIPANDASAGRTIIFGDERHLDNIHIEGNTFYEGSYGVFLEGWNDTFIYGTEIIGNTFIQNGYSGVYTNWNYAPKINYNTVEAKSYGIRVNGDYGAGQYSYNRIISENWGMLIHHIGEGIPRAVISNNFISIGKNGNYGITIQNSNNIDIYYNSVYVMSNSRTSSAFYAAYASYLTNVNIRNNNFANLNCGYALYIGTQDVVNLLDHNNLYTAGNYIAVWDNDKIIDLNELQKISGKNSNSLSVYPHYASYNDLHTSAAWLDGKGVPLVDFTVDIEGETRDETAPDIGADEFTPDPSTTTPLSAGTYTIGASGDYPDFYSAVRDAVMKGISVPTTYNVISGSYTEQIDFISVPGANSQNRITFQSQSGNPQDVEISFAATLLDSNYVMRFYGADFITLQNLTVTADGDPYARVVDFYHGADSIEIKNNVLNSIVDSGNDSRQAVIAADDSYYRSRIIEGNTLNRGTFGVFMRREQNNDELPLGAQILNNKIYENGYSGIHLQFYDSPVINNNIINASSKGIQALTCDGALKIQKNKINVQYSDGIYLSSCTATEEYKGLITNNFIYVGGSGSAIGIYMNNSPYQAILNNSVNITSSYAQAKAFYISSTSSTSATIINNIFMNSGGGYAYYITTPSTVSGSDYNDLYTTGSVLARWDGDRATLSDLQTASGMDANSVSVDPLFASATNLHANAAGVDSTGVSLAAVPDDIDGDTRDLSFPDIGADEFIFGFNYPPVITSEPDTIAYYAGELYEYQVTATDNNGDVLLYSLTTAPNWLSINDSTGLITGEPLSADVGDTVVTILVSDERGGTDSQTYTLHVYPEVGISLSDPQNPKKFILYQNYPNPFNPTTTIKYALAKNSKVILKVYNVLGQEIRALIDKDQNAGYKTVLWDGKNKFGQDVSSGLYFYRLETNEYIKTMKALLLR
jgi:parallel beta-helix repeat protein